MVAKGLMNAILLGGGIVLGGLAAVALTKYFNVYPLRFAGSYRGAQSNYGYGPGGMNDYTPSVGSAAPGGMPDGLMNTLPPIEPIMLNETDDWVARRNRGARWYS